MSSILEYVVKQVMRQIDDAKRGLQTGLPKAHVECSHLEILIGVAVAGTELRKQLAEEKAARERAEATVDALKQLSTWDSDDRRIVQFHPHSAVGALRLVRAEQRIEQLEAELQGVRDTLKDERYLHSDTLERYKRAASEITQRAHNDAASWRRVAERLESEKQDQADALAKAQVTLDGAEAYMSYVVPHIVPPDTPHAVLAAKIALQCRDTLAALKAMGCEVKG